MNRPTTLMATGAVLVAVAAAMAGCGSSAKTAAPTTVQTPTTTGTATGSATSTTTALPHGSGPVNVLYAGSLVALMQNQVGPAFHSATGYTFGGFSAGSTALATEIKGKVRQGDVFISASPAVDASLEGASNGNWVSWYATFASSPLVLGYNPSSKFASDIKAKPWYQAIAESGILLGRTDPATDPKGKLTAAALTAAAQQYNEPALTAISEASSTVFPEETLVGRLQAGQLDAGFFYSSEATAASIPTVPITVPNQTFKATYTVTILAGAPDEAAAEAFVAFLLGPQGQSLLQKDGFDLVQPVTLSGSGVPSSLASVIPGG